MGQVTPHLMTEAEAAYCAVTPSRFYQLVQAWTLPAAIHGTTRYDRIAIDRALDKLGGLTAEAEPSEFDKWLAENDYSGGIGKRAERSTKKTNADATL